MRFHHCCATALLLALSACSRESAPPAAPAATPAIAPGTTEQAPPAASIGGQLTPAGLDELLAPIALYPDVLVGQILAASTVPQEVIDGGNWLVQNEALQGDALDAASLKAGFGPAMRALVHFPTVVDMMASQMDWTRQVGDAYTKDPAAVLDSIQQLRGEAYRVGSLDSTSQQTVAVVTGPETGTEYIEIRPTDPKVVYVPQYDPAAVYAPPPATTLVVDNSGAANKNNAVMAGLMGFTAGILVANLFDDDDDDWYRPRWGYGGVYYGGRPWSPYGYSYRPRYYDNYRRYDRYERPVAYRNRFDHNNIYINQNNNYYGRFEGNGNRLPDRSPESPIANVRPDRGPQIGKGDRPDRPATPDRPALSALPRKDSSASWKGKDAYVGKDRNGSLPSGKGADAKLPARKPTADARPDRAKMPDRRPEAKPVSRPDPKPVARPVDKARSKPVGQARPGSKSVPEQRSGSKPTARPAQKREAARPSSKPSSGANPSPRPAQKREAARPSPKPSGGNNPPSRPKSSPEAKRERPAR